MSFHYPMSCEQLCFADFSTAREGGTPIDISFPFAISYFVFILSLDLLSKGPCSPTQFPGAACHTWPACLRSIKPITDIRS